MDRDHYREHFGLLQLDYVRSFLTSACSSERADECENRCEEAN